jgi:hypothetical protein
MARMLGRVAIATVAVATGVLVMLPMLIGR